MYIQADAKLPVPPVITSVLSLNASVILCIALYVRIDVSEAP